MMRSATGFLPCFILHVVFSCGPSRFNSNPVTPFNSNSNDNLIRSSLGGSVSTTSYSTVANGQNIQSSQDLNCDASFPCRWRNTPFDEAGDYHTADGVPDRFRIQQLTGTTTLPVGRFLIAASSILRAPGDRMILVSDPVGCLSSNGELSFRHWTSSGVEVRACIRNPGATNYQFCSSPIGQGHPGPTFVTIPAPRNEPFEIVMEASGFRNTNSGQGSFAIIDDINFQATLCGGFPGK